MKKILYIAIVVLFSNITIEAKKITENELRFRQSLDKLWTDHVVYMHAYIVSALNNLPNIEIIKDYLIDNQKDIGEFLAKYYGKEIGEKLTRLLREHLYLNFGLIDAIKEKNKTKINNIKDRWHDNAKAIAQLLNKINPKLNRNDLNTLLEKHLLLTDQQIEARFTKNWKKDIAVYDDVRKQILEFSNYLATGITQQFQRKL